MQKEKGTFQEGNNVRELEIGGTSGRLEEGNKKVILKMLLHIEHLV